MRYSWLDIGKFINVRGLIMKKWLVFIVLLLFTCVFLSYKHIKWEKVNEQANRKAIERFVQSMELGRMVALNYGGYNHNDLQTTIYDKDGSRNLADGSAALIAIKKELSNTKKVNKNIEVIDNKRVRVTGKLDDEKSFNFEEVYTFKNGILVYFECNNNIEINE